MAQVHGPSGAALIYRQSGAPQGTGANPHAILVGWLNVEARGRRRVTTACAYDVTHTGGDADSSPSSSWGRGRLSGDAMHSCLAGNPVFIGKQHQNQRKTTAAKNLALRVGAVLLLAMGASLSCEAKIHRDSTARHAFVKQQACPSTGRHRLPCPGYQIDHVWPLKCKGPDVVENMQWLTIEDHKAKTRREAKECRK